MAGQFSFGRDGNSTAHSPMLATLASMPEENHTVILTLKCSLFILDLSHFLFYKKVHHSAVTRPSYSSFVLTLFLALHRMLPWQIYKTKMGKQNLDMLLDILPNQDNAFRRYSSTPTFFISTLY
jgi:hypothetical protein